jgi:hypothetical protein
MDLKSLNDKCARAALIIDVLEELLAEAEAAFAAADDERWQAEDEVLAHGSEGDRLAVLARRDGRLAARQMV